MKMTAIIEAECDGYVSLCPELDIASQGDSIEQAGTIFARRWSCFRMCIARRGEATPPRRRLCHPSGGCHWGNLTLESVGVKDTGAPPDPN